MSVVLQTYFSNIFPSCLTCHRDEKHYCPGLYSDFRLPWGWPFPWRMATWCKFEGLTTAADYEWMRIPPGQAAVWVTKHAWPNIQVIHARSNQDYGQHHWEHQFPSSSASKLNYQCCINFNNLLDYFLHAASPHSGGALSTQSCPSVHNICVKQKREMTYQTGSWSPWSS